MSSKLSQYGYIFQIKLLVALLIDKIFLEQISDILLEEYFDSEANQWLARQIKVYFEKYKSSATFDALKIEILDIESDLLKTTVVEHLKDINKNFNATDLDYVKEKALKFCKNQKLKAAIMESINLLESEKYDEIKVLIDEASAAGIERDLGHDYTVDFEDRYNEALRKCVKTKWDVINDLMTGGLGAGELGVIVASAGAGKSWFLAAIGAAALKQGKKVIHYTLELSAAYTGLRYDAILTGIPFQNLKYHKEVAKEAAEEYKDSLLIKSYPATLAGINTIRAHTKRAESLGFAADLVIIDYADLLTTKVSRGNDNSYSIGGRLYEELRGLAAEIEVPIWTASQSHRCHVITDTVETYHRKLEIGRVKVGDEILTHKGYKKVINVFPIQKQPVYQIKLKSGKIITVSANHEIPTMYGKLKSIATGLKAGDKLLTKK